MNENFCLPFEQCKDLDGKLLIYRTIQGPALAREESELPFGTLTMRGAEVRPYVDFFFQQEWIVKEACYAPVRSVMGLAPGETVTIDITRREQVDYATLFRHAVDDVTVETQTSRHAEELVDVSPSTAQSPVVGLIPIIADAIGIGPVAEALTGGSINPLSLIPGFSGAGGLPFPGLGGGPALPGLGADPVTNLVTQLIQALLGSGQAGTPPVIQDTLTTIDETLTTIEHTESKHTLTERSTTVTRELEQRMTRTFTNPYQDRSLELRFIPVFRHFEVITRPLFGRIGLALNTGRLGFPEVGIGSRYGQFLERQLIDPRIASVANAELGLEGEAEAGVRSTAVYAHLDANAELYTKRFIQEAHREGNFAWLQTPLFMMVARHSSARQPPSEPTPIPRTGTSNPTPSADEPDLEAGQQDVAFLRGLAWSKATVQDNAIKVPLASMDAIRYYWPLSKETAGKLSDTVAALAPGAFAARLPQPHKKDVHLFIGTHIEAVPGQCVLPGLPSAEKPK
jgi:hypothetical protein